MRIRITVGGCGIKGRLYTKGHELDVDDSLGNDLIQHNAAVCVKSAEKTEPVQSFELSEYPSLSKDKASSEGKKTAQNEKPQYSADNTASELKAIMKANGLTVSKRMTKADMLKSLDALFSEDMPELSAEDVIV